MEYKCNICNKLYSSYQSLWIHNKKYHQTIAQIRTHIAHVSTVSAHNSALQVLNNHNCKFCNKNFSRNYCVTRHEQTCKQKVEDNKIVLLENKIKELESKIDNKSNKITTNNNNINHGTINNNTFIINKIGEESISKLKFKDIKNIFREQKNCLYHAIKYVNFNEKIPDNFYNSSLEGKYINVFNNDNNEIEKKNKKDFFDSILLSSINITNLLYDKFKNDLSKKKQIKLQNMVKEIENIAYLDNNKKLYITNFICTQ